MKVRQKCLTLNLLKGPSSLIIFSEGNKIIKVVYDQPIAYNKEAEVSGFYICYKRVGDCDIKQDTVKFWKYEIGRTYQLFQG